MVKRWKANTKLTTSGRVSGWATSSRSVRSMSSIQSVSFWQQDQNFYNQSNSLYSQDQNYWSQAQAQSQAQAADASLIQSMGEAQTNESAGLSSIANQTALTRTNSQISKLVQQLLNAQTGGSTLPSSSSGSSSSTSSASTTPSGPTPATGTGTVVLNTATPLANLGILTNGTITVTAGSNATTYTSTGSDTVGDLINALNVDLPTNAQVTASVNNKGQLVIASRNTTDSVSIAGSGTDAAAIGFSAGNTTFSPGKGSSGSTSSSSTASSSAASTSSSSSSASTSSTNKLAFTTPSQQTVSTAASLLAANGVSGTLVNLLA
jgi:hypothetical protein